MTNSQTITKITPPQKRQLQIFLSDYINNRPAKISDEEYFATIGKLTAMAAGTIAYEPVLREFHAVKPPETGDKLFTAYFVASAGDMRTVKLCLQTSFDLVHLPQAKEIPGEDGYKRFRVVGVTKEAAQAVFSENTELFTRITFNDEDRESSGQRAETTLPKTPRQRKQVQEVPQVVEAEVEIPEEVVQDPVDREAEDAAFGDEEEIEETSEVAEAPELAELSDEENEENM